MSSRLSVLVLDLDGVVADTEPAASAVVTSLSELSPARLEALGVDGATVEG